MTAGASARTEWRRHPMLPLAGGLGYATSVIHIYGLGPYIQPISETFGWTRAQITFGLTLSTIIQAIFSVPIGIAVDRFGSRRFALVGTLLTTGAYALLGTVNGTLAHWALLWALMALATLPVQATVWTSAVVSRFEASRGLALAVTLCGASLAAIVFPLLAAWLIGRHGWQTAMMLQGGIWTLVTYPIILFFFRGAHDRQRAGDSDTRPSRDAMPGVPLAEGLRSSVYWRLILASLLFTFTIIALVVHFVPILTDRGADPLKAAGIASAVGIASIVGRMTTGWLLDRYRPSLVGAAVFMLPVAGCLLLLGAGGSVAGQIGAAAMIGLTLGAEIDVIVYLTTRHFGMKHFGALYGGLLAALSIGTATGPLGAAAVFDSYGNYVPFLWLTIGFMVASSLALASMPQPRHRY